MLFISLSIMLEQQGIDHTNWKINWLGIENNVPSP